MSVRRASLAAAVLVLAAGCGSEAATTSATLTTPVTQPTVDVTGTVTETVTGTVTTDALLGCLSTAGLDARTVATTPYGVSDPVVVIAVSSLESYDGAHDQGAMLYVFDDAVAATANAAVITLGQTDDPTNDMYGVHGNVVRAMSIVLQPDPHTDDEQAVLDCLPPSGSAAEEPADEPSSGPVAGGELADCLTGSGLTATVEGEDADDVGTYSALARVLVTDMTGSVAGAKIWVFADATTRAEHTADIWFGGTPSPRLLERGNTLTLLDAAPEPGDLSVAALEQCLPA